MSPRTVVDAAAHNEAHVASSKRALAAVARPALAPHCLATVAPRVDDGTALHLCGDCNERAISHYGRQPNERDMVQIAARGAGLGFARTAVWAQELGLDYVTGKEQPCAACGRETRPGSALFAGRRSGVDRQTGAKVVLCASCVADRQTHGDRPSDSRLGTIELADTFNR